VLEKVGMTLERRLEEVRRPHADREALEVSMRRGDPRAEAATRR